MNKAKVYIKENKERFISELLDLLRIPSISAQSERKPEGSVGKRLLLQPLRRGEDERHLRQVDAYRRRKLRRHDLKPPDRETGTKV